MSACQGLGGMSAGNPQLVEAVQQRLAALGVAEVAVGQDAYFKGVIRHRGIKMPALDATCKEFLAGQQEAAPAELRQLGLELLRQPLQVRPGGRRRRLASRCTDGLCTEQSA